MKRKYLIDTTVIYSYTLRDCFITLATEGIKVHWSAQIEAEFIRARGRKSHKDAIKARETLALMRIAVPDWRASASGARIAALSLPDPNDRHVLAAAIQVGANVIVTDNCRDFPKLALVPHGIDLMSPDQALCELYDGDPERMIRAAAEMHGRMLNPLHTPDEWLERLNKAGAKALAERLRPFADRL